MRYAKKCFDIFDTENGDSVRKIPFEKLYNINEAEKLKDNRILDCTRQNLSYMVNKGSLKPVKEDVKGNLYQKGNLYNLDE